ncbi:HIT domain-containing protein [Chloroflexota bacterium]
MTPVSWPIKIAPVADKESDMERIWAPWRIQYIQMEKPEGCILCEKPKQDKDELNYILHRGEKNFIILNSYPYNPAHLMVASYRHVASLEELTEAERHEHFEIVSRSVSILRQVFNPGGFNIGINLGKVAGAGIDDHFHTHIVPRWQGDTNFMPVQADIKVLPEALADTYQKLRGKF